MSGTGLAIILMLILGGAFFVRLFFVQKKEKETQANDDALKEERSFSKLATERSVKYLKNYMKRNFSGYNGRINLENWMRTVGITDSELDKLLNGEMLLDELRFYKFLNRCCEYDYSSQRGRLPDWFIAIPNWELVGLVERTITLEKVSGKNIAGLQGIIKVPVAIIDDPEVYIEEGDKLKHRFNESTDEYLYIEEVVCNRHQINKPAYVLTVRMGNKVADKADKVEVHNTNILGGISVVQGDKSNATVGKTSELSLKTIITIVMKFFSGLFK